VTELIAHETLAVVVPTLLDERCAKWTRLALLQLLVKLTDLHALFGLGLGNLCRLLVTWARAEGPTAPVVTLTPTPTLALTLTLTPTLTPTLTLTLTQP
jgi:hypothetical protein